RSSISAQQTLMMQAPYTWLEAVFGLTTRPQSCTATILFILTTPVSVSTETSAITMPATPPVFNPSCGAVRGLFSPVSVILLTPSLFAACANVMDLSGLPFTRMVPSTASSVSGSALSDLATTSNSFCNAFTVDLRVEEVTPPIVVDPPEPPEVG